MCRIKSPARSQKGAAHLMVMVLIGSITAGLVMLYFFSIQNALIKEDTDLSTVAESEIDECPGYFDKKTCGKKEIDGAEVCKIEKDNKNSDTDKKSKITQTWYCCPKDDIFIKYSKRCCDSNRVYISMNYDDKLGWKQDKACCSVDLDEDGNCPNDPQPEFEKENLRESVE